MEPTLPALMFRLPFDAAGKRWVGCAVWDSAGPGAFTLGGRSRPYGRNPSRDGLAAPEAQTQRKPVLVSLLVTE